MSFWCNNNCKRADGTIGVGICRCCPTAEYYRNQYRIDQRGRAIISNFGYPLPVNMQDLDFNGYGFYFSTYNISIAQGEKIPFNAAAAQNFLNTTLDGDIILVQPGVYRVTYNVYSQTGGTVRLELDAMTISGSEVTGTDIITGSVIVVSTSYPAVLSLINSGINNIDLIAGANGASAQLVVSQVSLK